MEFFEPGTEGVSDVKNAVVIPPAAIDRSPCGTGTSAKMALLHAEGKLAVGQSFVHESLIGVYSTAISLKRQRWQEFRQ